MKLTLTSQQQKDRAIEYLKALDVSKPMLLVVTEADTRSLDQNAKLWPMLSDISKQVEWHGMKLKPEEWKDMFSASLKQQKVVPGIDGGGFVVVGMSTKKMSKKVFSDLIEIIYAFGSERCVRWSDSVSRREEY